MIQDEALQQAKKHADKAIEKLMAEVEAKRWKLVADNLKLFKVRLSPACLAMADRT